MSSAAGWSAVKVNGKLRDTFTGDVQSGIIHPHDVGSWLNENRDRSQIHLNRYFGDSQPDGFTYSGRHFEWFVEQGAEAQGFSPFHLLAVSSLSVNVPAHVSRMVLSSDEKIESLLKDCFKFDHGNEEITLWNFDPPHFAAYARLYDRLNAEADMGKVTTSKLLAAKFPNIVPIRDSLVEKLLGLEKSETWWNHIQAIMYEPSIRYSLSEPTIPTSNLEVGLLRRLDVILWMEARARSQSDDSTLETP